MNARFVTLTAGVLFFFLAVFTQGLLPFLEPTARTKIVTAVVRTDLGQLKWVQTESTDYTPLLVLPFTICSPSDRRNPPLGPREPSWRIRL